MSNRLFPETMPYWKRIKTWVLLELVSHLGARMIRLLGRSLSLSWKGLEYIDTLHAQGQGVIIAFWHGRQLMMPLAYRGKSAHILISQHHDGEFIYRIVRQFGFRSVRGSSTRGGGRALRQLIRIGKGGGDIVVTPDGPKGPREVVQLGIMYLAKITGLPIVPLTFACSKKKSFRVGTVLWCPFLGPRGCLCGALPFGWNRP